MIKNFKRRPTTVQAVQFFSNLEEIKEFAGEALVIKTNSDKYDNTYVNCYIRHLEETLKVSHGDIIVRYENGIFDVFDPNLFHVTYEEIREY